MTFLEFLSLKNEISRMDVRVFDVGTDNKRTIFARRGAGCKLNGRAG